MKKIWRKSWLSYCGFVSAGVFCLVLGLSGFAAGQEKAGVPSGRSFACPAMVYVADFALNAEKGNAPPSPLQVRKRLKNRVEQLTESPEEKARKIVDLLAQSIVEELNGKNIKAVRYSGKTAPVSQTWLLEGEFVEYGDGDRLGRAVIGFGAGSPEMEVGVRVSEIFGGGVRPLFDSTMNGKKNRMPGAVVSKNPYVAGAKFVMTKAAPEREVKKLGAQIADKLIEAMGKDGLEKP
jgi:hypothetical protein